MYAQQFCFTHPKFRGWSYPNSCLLSTIVSATNVHAEVTKNAKHSPGNKTEENKARQRKGNEMKQFKFLVLQALDYQTQSFCQSSVRIGLKQHEQASRAGGLKIERIHPICFR